MTLAQGLVLVCAALLGLLGRQDAVRIYVSHSLTYSLERLRRGRRGRHAQALSRPHLRRRSGNHVAFTDKTTEHANA